MDAARVPYDATVFVVDGVAHTWADVLTAARWWGEDVALDREARAGLSCEREADAAGAGPDRATVRAAARTFRYSHRLISAEELEAWLARWRLTAGEWLAWLRRRVVLETQSPAGDQRAVDPEDVAAVRWPTAVCSGRLSAWARELARRSAAAAAVGRMPAAGLPDETRLALLDAALADFREQSATPQAVQRLVATRWLDWSRIDCSWVELASTDAGDEARLCVEHDGRDLQAVAALAGAVASQRRLWLDDVPAALRQPLRSARDGELIGPVVIDDRTDVLPLRCLRTFVLVQLHTRTAPDPEDPEVLARGRAAVADRELQVQVHSRVRWHEPV